MATPPLASDHNPQTTANPKHHFLSQSLTVGPHVSSSEYFLGLTVNDFPLFFKRSLDAFSDLYVSCVSLMIWLLKIYDVNFRDSMELHTS